MPASTTPLHGWTAPGWEAVREAFAANFADGIEVGAAFAAFHRGRPVVDLWGGIADPATGAPWQEDTIVLVYSTTKGPTTLCAHRLADAGLLDLAAPVAEYWPEFAAAGKEAVTVAQLLSHRAGLPWVDGTLTLAEALAWDPAVEALARQAPVWVPGTAHGYHAVTFGWLVGEVVRRVSGRSLGTYLAEEVAGPLGASFWVGLPAEHEGRVARLVPAPGGGGVDLDALLATAGDYLAPDGPLTKALAAPGGAFGGSDEAVWNDPALHRAEVPAANGIGDARSVARIYSAAMCETETPSGDRRRLLSGAALARAIEQQTEGPDRVLLGLDLQWGLGFMVHRGLLAEAQLGGPRAFGHMGLGGSLGWADPDRQLAMGYVMNGLSLAMAGDLRSVRLVHACLDAARAAGA